MNVEDYLKTHRLINIGTIESELGLTKGTLRKDKPIPDKYRSSIETILKDYGYLPSIDALQSTIIPEVIVSVQKEVKPVIDKDMMLCECSVNTVNMYRDKDNMLRRYNLDKGTKYYITLV